jgi:ammonium transporter, Amt family
MVSKTLLCRAALVALVMTIGWAAPPGAWAQDDAAAPAADTAAAPAADTAAVPAPAADPAAPPPPGRPYFAGLTAPDPGGSGSGVWATPAADPTGDDPSKMGVPDVYDRVVHNLFSINMVWTMIAGFLVMFMQAGFAMVEGGLCRAKNSSHTFAMNMMIYPLGCLAFWAYGFALGWGNWFNAPVGPGWYPSLGEGLALLNSGIGIGGSENLPMYGLMGTKGFFLHGLDDVSVMGLFFFMMVFMDTTATIPTGTMAERWSWKNFCLFGLWVALPYCLFANWVWGGGWLAQAGKNWGLGHGAVDFAGSGVVHAMGGAIALAGGMIIGPRIGKYVNGKPQAIPGHSIPMVVIGTFILAFGWFGFNPGSTLSGTDLRIATVVVNTMLAGICGALSCMVYMMIQGMKPDPSMMCNGMLAGLVAVTAPCAFIDSWAAAVIGAIAGVIVVISVFFWDRVGIDDPVGAISVHGVNGLWGIISLGIFANGQYGVGWNGVVRTESKYLNAAGGDGVRGILFGDSSQLMAQLLDAATVAVFGFLMAYAWFKISNLITPIRVSREVELEGLDMPEMGAHGYPDFALTGHAYDA